MLGSKTCRGLTKAFPNGFRQHQPAETQRISYCAISSTNLDEEMVLEVNPVSSPSMMVGWHAGVQLSDVRKLPW